MPRPRTPKAKAKVTGSSKRNPARFEERSEPMVMAPLGEPPDWMNADQLKAWNQFASELFWLNDSNRALLEIACTVRARLIAPKSGEEPVGVQALNLLRQCLGQMGATPADASKVTLPDGQQEKDPAEKYFGKRPSN